jgi:hypothetical protein
MSLSDLVSRFVLRRSVGVEPYRPGSIVLTCQAAPAILSRLQELRLMSGGSPSTSLRALPNGFEILVSCGSSLVSRGAADLVIRFISTSVPIVESNCPGDA